MKLAYLLLFVLLAYITSRMAAAYTDMSSELRELRIRCMRGGATASEEQTEASSGPAAGREKYTAAGELSKASAYLQKLANKFE